MTLSLRVHDIAREVEAMLEVGCNDASLRAPLQALAERFDVRL